MRKMLFKKILSILDAIELQGVSLHDAPLRVYEEIAGEYYAMKLSEIRDLIGFLNEKKMLKTTPRGIDLRLRQQSMPKAIRIPVWRLCLYLKALSRIL